MNYVKYSTEKINQIPSRFTRLIWSYAAQSHVREKEIKESLDFIERIRPFIKGKNVLELFCGHGMIGHLARLKGARSVIQIDKYESKSHGKLFSYFGDYTGTRFEIMDIVKQKAEILSFDFNVVIAMHACGNLSDLAIDIAVEKGADLALCPCCYHGAALLQSMHGVASQWTKPVAVDSVRVARLSLLGYETSMRLLNISISTCNHIIIARKGHRGE